jgi:uncharacterized RDD family membrane protein YckC
LIDVLLISILWSRAITIAGTSTISVSSPAGLAALAGLLFVYWTALEGYRGQSLGKMLLNIAVVGPVGEKIGFRDAAIESFGKAFLLPLDWLAGWYLYRKSGQRVFNRLSNTIVASSSEVGW